MIQKRCLELYDLRKHKTKNKICPPAWFLFDFFMTLKDLVFFCLFWRWLLPKYWLFAAFLISFCFFYNLPDDRKTGRTLWSASSGKTRERRTPETSVRNFPFYRTGTDLNNICSNGLFINLLGSPDLNNVCSNVLSVNLLGSVGADKFRQFEKKKSLHIVEQYSQMLGSFPLHVGWTAVLAGTKNLSVSSVARYSLLHLALCFLWTSRKSITRNKNVSLYSLPPHLHSDLIPLCKWLISKRLCERKRMCNFVFRNIRPVSQT